VNDREPASALRRERERTADLIADLTRQVEAIVASTEFDAVDDEHDPDGATIGFERAQATALLDAARARLVEIDNASERVRLGRYGVCEVCGASIPTERLVARPATSRCVACAAR
jgi:RNA polymerase-binding transcription factor